MVGFLTSRNRGPTSDKCANICSLLSIAEQCTKTEIRIQVIALRAS